MESFMGCFFFLYVSFYVFKTVPAAPDVEENAVWMLFYCKAVNVLQTTKLHPTSFRVGRWLIDFHFLGELDLYKVGPGSRDSEVKVLAVYKTFHRIHTEHVRENIKISKTGIRPTMISFLL